MLVRYGGGIIGASGSIAGNTHARNRFGNYVRARTKPINPRSHRQMASRILVQLLAEQWRTSPMTPAIREAWETYAASVNWNNALGEVVKLTGYDHFIRSNAARMAAGLAMITAGPPDLGLPNSDPAFVVTGSEADEKLSIAFDNTLAWANETGGALAVHMGRPQNPSRTFFGGPYRYADKVAGVTGTPPTSGVEIDPPFTLIAGQKIWCEARIVRLDGRVSTLFGCAPFAVGA